MSDHVQSFGASDSGFLDAFSGVLHGRHGAVRRGHESRVGADLTPGEHSGPAAGMAADNAQLDRLLRDAPLPEGLLERLRRIADLA